MRTTLAQSCQTAQHRAIALCPLPKDNGFSIDIATLAIFPEYVEFDGEEVLKLVVQGEAGRTIR